MIDIALVTLAAMMFVASCGHVAAIVRRRRALRRLYDEVRMAGERCSHNVPWTECTACSTGRSG